MEIKNNFGPVARLGRNQRYECHLGIPRLASSSTTALAQKEMDPINKLIFLKSTQKPLSINSLSMQGYENAKKCLLIDPHYVKKKHLIFNTKQKEIVH